jgi:lipopolysaccharide biosynthesis glycosyltransferase
MKEAIVVTIAIGFLKPIYEKIFIPSIKAYSEKWGFDFLCIDDYIKDVETKNINVIYLQKFLISSLPQVQEYKYVIFIDADILINFDKAPNILLGIPEGKIAAVDEKTAWGNCDNVSSTLKKYAPHWASTAEEYYKYYKYPKTFSKQFNSGVFIFQPSFHKNFFEELYNKYIDRAILGEDIGGDQAPFNYEANSQDLVYYLDERFNRPWIITWGIFYPFLNDNDHKPLLQQAVKSVFEHSYFLHFAGKEGWSLLI